MKNKKAIVLLMASAIVLSLVGCAGSTSEAAEASSEIPLVEAISDEPVDAASIENSDSEASDSASAIDNSALQDDQFQYNGKIISVMDDLNALINAFDYSKPETYDIQSFYTSKDHSVTLETLKKDEIDFSILIGSWENDGYIVRITEDSFSLIMKESEGFRGTWRRLGDWFPETCTG